MRFFAATSEDGDELFFEGLLLFDLAGEFRDKGVISLLETFFEASFE